MLKLDGWQISEHFHRAAGKETERWKDKGDHYWYWAGRGGHDAELGLFLKMSQSLELKHIIGHSLRMTSVMGRKRSRLPAELR